MTADCARVNFPRFARPGSFYSRGCKASRNMESEQSQNFNERLSEWVANQGFWFQLRYSLMGSGTKGRAMFHLLRMAIRVLAFLVIIGVGAGYYLVKRPQMKGFYDGFQSSIKQGLSASEIELRGLSQVQGELNISGVACKGDDKAFFSTLDARTIRCKMGFFDGIAGKWKPGTIFVAAMDLELRAGADDDEGSKALGDSWFKEFGGVDLNTFEVADASVRWGYGRTVAPKNLLAGDTSPGYEFDHTRGSISNSFLRIQRSNGQVRLSFKGGIFSQNWLEKLEIVSLEITGTREGLVFEKAEFRRLQGTVDFSGLKVTSGTRPLIDGGVKIRNLALPGIIPSPVRSFVEGALSGDFRVSGSTNSSEGIVFDGQVTLGAQDIISLRERIHLLKALSVVDYARNYHRIDFREGSFHMKTYGGGMELTNLALKSDDLTTLEGGMVIRLPTVEETNAAVEKGGGLGGAPIFNGEDPETDSLQRSVESEFTLNKAGILASKDSNEAGQVKSNASLFTRLELNQEKRRLDAVAAERISRTLYYKGTFKLSLPADVFERAPRLVEQFPVDLTTGRVPLMVPIEGGLYELTLRQAEDIYQQGRR